MLPSGEKSVLGRSMVIQDVSRHHTGVYTCTADNGVGQPASADIDLKVLCEYKMFIQEQLIQKLVK